MRYEAYLGTSKKEIEDFYVGGKQVEELWDGDTLLWKKNGVKIRENVANFCGFSKSVSQNGAELLSVGYDGDVFDDTGSFLELFTGEGTYTKRLVTCNDKEYCMAISLDNYFYAIKRKGIPSHQEQTITAFYKFGEDGNIIYSFYNARAVPTDVLDESMTGWYLNYDNFYVINDTFYTIFEVGSHNSTPEKMANWFYIVAYKNGSCISQRLVDTGIKYGYNPMEALKCSNQFRINGINILSGRVSYNTYHYCYPLVKVTENTFSVLNSFYYTYIGTDRKYIYLTDTFGCNDGRRKKLFSFDGENYKCIIDLDKIDIGTSNCDFVAAVRIEDVLYAAVTYGDFHFCDHSYVIAIDEKEPKKSKIIYKLNASSKKKNAWAAIRQLTTKNGKLYVHKAWQKSWTDDKAKIGIDEITFPSKKGDKK